MGWTFFAVRVLHVLGAAIWIGSAFFGAWFVMPAVRETGPDGGKVMAAIQKRGWVAFVPSIAGLTVLSGLWLYRPYMGDSGHAAALYGYGGVTGIIAMILAGSVVGRSIRKAGDVAAKAASMPEGPDRAALIGTAAQLRQRALTFARIVSVLIIIVAAIMTMAKDL